MNLGFYKQNFDIEKMAQESAVNFRSETDSVKEENSKLNNVQKINLSSLVFEKADYEKAQEQIVQESNQFNKGKKVSSFAELDHFKIYGVGIFTFFSFTWSLSIVFLILSVLSIIPMVYNYINGNVYGTTINNLEISITRFSIGAYNYPGMTETNANQLSLANKHLNVFTDFACSIIFFIFYFYWERRSKKIQTQIYKDVNLPSQFTVQVTEFPQCANEQVIGEFMERFGKITQVAAVSNYQQKIYLSKEIFELQLQLKQLQELQKIQHTEKNEEKMRKIQQKIQKLYDKLNTVQSIQGGKYIKFFVTFQNQDKRNEVLQKFKPYQKLLSCCQQIPEQLMINSQKVNIQPCFTEPAGIIWENAHVTWATRWVRMLIQFLIILALVNGGFLLISFLNILVPNYNFQGIDISSITVDNIASVTDEDQKTLWCINNLSTYYSDASISQICYNYWQTYIIDIFITIGISLAVVLFKAIVKIIVITLAKFQRYTSHTQQSVTMMTNLMVTYISTTILITFLMQANVIGISFKNTLLYIVSDDYIRNNLINLTEYQDLTHEWYIDIGYQIWFNSLILAFIPHIVMPIVHQLLQCLARIFAKGQKFHKNMVNKLRKPDFEIQDHYAQILMIMFIGLFFGGCMPAIVPISFIGIITKYVYFKIAFIKYSRIPKSYNQALNNRAMSIMKICLILKCIFATWVFGVNDIFVEEVSIFNLGDSIVLVDQLFLLIDRIFITWYYSMLTILFILAFILRDTLVEIVLKMCLNDKKQNQKATNKKRQSIKIEPMNINEIQSPAEISSVEQPAIISQKALTKSYRIQNNPDYCEILDIMHLSQTKRANKST